MVPRPHADVSACDEEIPNMNILSSSAKDLTAPFRPSRWAVVGHSLSPVLGGVDVPAGLAANKPKPVNRSSPIPGASVDGGPTTGW
jgi:hypothetical protein